MPSRGAASGAEALRALGVSAGNAAAGLHSPQHSWDGVDPIPSQPICFLRRPSGMGSMLASNTITWSSGASTNSTMWSASDPTKISIPTPGLYVFASTFELVYTCGDANFVSSESVYKSGNLVFIYFAFAFAFAFDSCVGGFYSHILGGVESGFRLLQLTLGLGQLGLGFRPVDVGRVLNGLGIDFTSFRQVADGVEDCCQGLPEDLPDLFHVDALTVS